MNILVSNRVDRGLCCFLKRSLDLDKGLTDFMSSLPLRIRSILLKLLVRRDRDRYGAVDRRCC